MRIKEVMNQPAITCSEADSADNAARLMWEFDCGIIPVLHDDGRLAGVITDRDICMAAYTQGEPLRGIPVTRGMAKHVIAIHADDSVETAEILMRDNQIRRLPVVDDDGRPLGVVSMNDLARLAGRVKRTGVDREVVDTLSAISQPRGQTDETPDALQHLAI
jgi:CBS domain-containing protein